MAKTKDQTKGIFCLEACAWFGSLKDKTTVEPVLRLLESTKDYRVPYLHFDVATREELDFYIKKWCSKGVGESHPILYLAFHGEADGLFVGEGRGNRLNLNQLGERLDGKCRGRIIHFGSCATVDVPDHALNAFLRRTGALAVFGYRADVEWLKSAAFDLLVLGGLQRVSFLRGASIQNFGDKLLKDAPGLARTLEFRIKVNPG